MFRHLSMKFLLYILLVFVVLFVAYFLYEMVKTIRRYHADPAYRGKMDRRAKALERKKRMEKDKKRRESAIKFYRGALILPSPIRKLYLGF